MGLTTTRHFPSSRMNFNIPKIFLKDHHMFVSLFPGHKDTFKIKYKIKHHSFNYVQYLDLYYLDSIKLHEFVKPP